jgi:hypothetical protein
MKSNTKITEFKNPALYWDGKHRAAAAAYSPHSLKDKYFHHAAATVCCTAVATLATRATSVYGHCDDSPRCHCDCVMKSLTGVVAIIHNSRPIPGASKSRHSFSKSGSNVDPPCTVNQAWQFYGKSVSIVQLQPRQPLDGEDESLSCPAADPAPEGKMVR